MDYDDNEFQGQNLQLGGEGCSKVSPVLHSYALPKFEFDDSSLQGHLRFDSLVENDVLFGITNHEDHLWIEEYSRGSSGIEFSSSAVESSRRINVWSEATSSESVEMLLKSVGQEEKVVVEPIIQELDISDDPGSVIKIMDPNLNQSDEKDHVTLPQTTSQTKELDSVVISEKFNLSVSEEKVDKTFDDIIQKEAENLDNLENPGSLENASASHEELKCQENPLVDLKDNVHEESIAASANAQNMQDENEKSEGPESSKSHAGSLTKISPIENPSVDENEYDMGKNAQQITSDATNLPDTHGEVITKEVSNDDVIAGKNDSEVHTVDTKSTGAVQVECETMSSEPGAIHLSEDVSFNEKEDGSFPVEGSSDMVIDNQKNVEPSENTVTAPNFESDVAIQVEQGQVSAMESDKSHLPMAETDDQPKSPIFGVSLVHQDNKEKAEQVESVEASASKIIPPSTVEKEASPKLTEKVVREIDVQNIEQEPKSSTGGQESFVDKPQFVSPTHVSGMEVSQSAKDKQETSKSVTNDNILPSETTDSLSKATQEEKNFTFEVNRNASVGQTAKGFQSYPTFQVTMSPKITQGQSMVSSSSQADAKKQHEVSLSPQNPSGLTLTPQTGVKGKPERKPRRRSVGKESARKGTPSKETTPTKDSVRVEKSHVSLTPPAIGQVAQFHEVKSNENVKPGCVLPLPKLPDLNNSTPIFQQPFTDNQQVQLRAQILVYGSLISGSPPEEPHMIAAFGQSDGGRIWEGVWRACLERLHLQKAQTNSNTPMQPRSDMRDAGNRVDQGIKHTSSIQNKITSTTPSGGASNKGTPTPTPPSISPMIPLSSPLWNISTPSDNIHSSSIPRPNFHQPLSPLHAFQTTPVQNFSAQNPSWLSQGPFAGQWVAAFNTGPRFPPMPITDSVKLTPVKEPTPPGVKHTSTPMVLNSSPILFPETSSLTPTDSKSRKRKKGGAKQISEPIISAPVVFHLPQVPLNQTDSVTPPVVSSPFSSTSKTAPPKFLFASPPVSVDRNMEKVVKISDESLTKVEEAKLQAEEAAKRAADAVSHCHGIWSQLASQSNSGLTSDDEAKLVSSAVSIAAAASVAKVAAAAAKIASDVAEQARSMVTVFPCSVNSSKHAENMDAIVKAAELAAEAVSQAGKIVAMSEPLPLKLLIETGPEGYWKTPELASKQQILKTAESAPDKGIPTKKPGLDLAENQRMEIEKDKRKPRARKGSDLLKTVAVEPELDHGSINTPIVGQIEPDVTSVTLKENNIKEGCLVEVYKDENKQNSAWFGANVLSIKDGKALVCYTEIQADDGSGALKEWVPLEVDATKVPKIRVAHPLTTMRLEGTRKRRRTAATDFVWSSGDRVDVWMQDRWREGVVMETNKIDLTSLTVQFPGQGETSVVRSWFLRPTLIWKDNKWVESHTPEKRRSFQSQGDAPQEKRLKLGSPLVETKRNNEPSESVDHVDLKKQEESTTLPLSTHESLFNIGSSKEDKNIRTHRGAIRSGLQKDREGSRVVFGVPKPGKKQKFMDVSKHYVADESHKNKNSNTIPAPIPTPTPHDSSIKFTRYLIPQAPGSRGWRNNPSRNDTKEKQVAETKPRLRKPPVPTLRSLTSSKSVASDDENQLGHQNEVDDVSASSSFEVSTKSERPNKRKFVPTGGKVTKVEKQHPEAVEPRRSNRKIQPTSRLLEGLQSSMTISKIPFASHSSQRKVTPKGNNNG